MRAHRFLSCAAVAGCLALGACAAPDIRPQLAATSSEALGLADGEAPTIDRGWWRALGDPQLDAIITRARAANPTLALALARVRRADAMLAAQKATAGPTGALDATTSVQRLPEHYIIPPPYGGSVHFLGEVSAGLGWNLDLFGRQRAAIASARAAVDAARLDSDAATLLLEGAVVETYLDLARAEQQKGLLEETVRLRADALALTGQRVAAGLADRTAAEEAKGDLARARALLAQAEGARAAATHALAALAGAGRDYADALRPTAIGPATRLPLPAVVPADLLARRADIAAAKANVAAAAAGRQVARRAFYPDINLAALVGLQSVGLSELFQSGSGVVGGSAALHLPLFDRAGLRADLRAATADLDQAIATYNSRVTDAVQEAADAVTDIARADAEQHAQQQAVASGRAALKLGELRAGRGLLSQLDLIDGRVALADARRMESSAAIDALVARARLAQALGGGFAAPDTANANMTAPEKDDRS